MDRNTACFFTGHRALPNDPKIERELYNTIDRLISMGITDFITGGAMGFDTLAAKAVISRKKDNPYIRLHLYLPCYDHMSRWSPRNQFMGRMIMSYADEKIYTTESKYIMGCMHVRNKKMAMDAKYCVAYCKRSASGTNVTINYALSCQDVVYNIAEII